MRVGQKQKKIDITIPKLDDFIHKTYINVARKIYKNIYLFELDIPPLQAQKNNREIEIIVQECVINTIRDSIPVETILKAYMDETVEEDVTEEIKEDIIEEKITEEPKNEVNVSTTVKDNTSANANLSTSTSEMQIDKSIKFDNIDYVKDDNNIVSQIEAPKTIERLEEISAMRNNISQQDDEDDFNEKLNISDIPISLDTLDIHTIEEPKMELKFPELLDDIEVLS
jgi:hypothetical protein